MAWKRLTDMRGDILYRGARFRFVQDTHRGQTEVIEYMAVLLYGDKSSGLGLVRTSGYKAGHVLVNFPDESSPPGHVGISVDWLLKNAKKWIGVNKTDILVTKDKRKPRMPVPK